MRLILLLSLSFGTQRSRAEVKFDTWKFSELLVTGMKASRNRFWRADNSAVHDELRTMLAQLNFDLDRAYRKEPELGLERARSLLAPLVRDVWATERDAHYEASQRDFLEKVLALGLGPSIAAGTEKLAQTFFLSHPGDGVFLKNHLWLAPISLAVTGGVIWITPSNDIGWFLSFLTLGISGYSYVEGFRYFAAHNRAHHFKYELNYIGPVFRECELELLRPAHSRRGA